MFSMSENEQFEQIGKLAAEYSEVKGRLNHIEEKLVRAQADYQAAGRPDTFPKITVQNGEPFAVVPPNQRRTLDGLLDSHQLVEVLETRGRLRLEVAGLAERLKAIAPHLI
jgi:hypothetical protein